MADTLRDEAKMLAARAADLKTAPLFQQPRDAAALADDMGRFLVRMAHRVDGLTPFQDEAG